MEKISILAILFLSKMTAFAQSVLIDPTNKASINLSSATKLLLLTGLNNEAMNNII